MKELELFKEHIRQDTVQKKYIAKYVEAWDAELKILEARRAKAEIWVQELKRMVCIFRLSTIFLFPFTV